MATTLPVNVPQDMEKLLASLSGWQWPCGAYYPIKKRVSDRERVFTGKLPFSTGRI